MNIDIESSELRFLHFNVRTEQHGSDEVTAIDLKLQWTTSSQELQQFHPGLAPVLYALPGPQQAPVDGVEPVATVRAFPNLAPLHWEGEVGCAILTMHHGLADDEDLV